MSWALHGIRTPPQDADEEAFYIEPEVPADFVATLVDLGMHIVGDLDKYPLRFVDSHTHVEVGRVHFMWGKTLKATCKCTDHPGCTMLVNVAWFSSLQVAKAFVAKWLAQGRTCNGRQHSISASDLKREAREGVG
jgi:hypothetical protein